MGTHQPSIDQFGDLYQVSNTQKASEFVCKDASALKEAIKSCRIAAVKGKKIDWSKTESKLTGGEMLPETAV